MDFSSMKRKELQDLCKKNGIPAKLKNVEMVKRLTSLLKDKEKQSCLKNEENDVVNDDEEEGEKVVGSKEVKRVRFSPQNETFEFEKTDPREWRLLDRKRRVHENSLKGKDPVLVSENMSENVGGENPKRGGSRRKSVVSSVSEIPVEVGCVEKKPVGRSVRRKTIVKLNVSNVEELVEKENPVEVGCVEKPVGRSLRRKITVKRNVSNVEELLEKENLVEVGCVEKLAGRSLRRKTMVKPNVSNVEELVEKEDLVEVGCIEKPIGRSLRRRTMMKVDVSNVGELVGNQNPDRNSRGRRRGMEKKDVEELLLSPCNEKKAKRGRKGNQVVEKGGVDGIGKPPDKEVVARRRQTRSRKVATKNSSQVGDDAVIEISKSENAVQVPRRSTRPMENAKGRDCALLSDEDAGKKDLGNCIENNKKRKRGQKKGSTVKENEVKGVSIGDVDPENAVIERSVDSNVVVGRKLRGKAPEVEVLKENNVVRRSTRQAEKKIVDGSSEEQGLADNAPPISDHIDEVEEDNVVETDCIRKEETSTSGAGLDNSLQECKKSEVEEKYDAAGDYMSTKEKAEKGEDTVRSSQRLSVWCDTTKSENHQDLEVSVEISCENAEAKASSSAHDEGLALSLQHSDNDGAKCSPQANNVFTSPLEFHKEADKNFQPEIMSTVPTIRSCKFEGTSFGSKAAESLIGANSTVCSSIAKSTASENRKVFDGDGELSFSSVSEIGSEIRGSMKFTGDEGAEPCNQIKHGVDQSEASPVNEGSNNADEKMLDIPTGISEKYNDQLMEEDDAAESEGTRESDFKEVENMACNISDGQFNQFTVAEKVVVVCEASVETNVEPPVIVRGLIPSSKASSAIGGKSKAVGSVPKTVAIGGKSKAVGSVPKTVAPFQNQELESITNKNKNAAVKTNTGACNFDKLDDELLDKAEREGFGSSFREAEIMEPEVSEKMNQFSSTEEVVVACQDSIEHIVQPPSIVEGLNPSEVSIAAVCKSMAVDKDVVFASPLQNWKLESRTTYAGANTVQSPFKDSSTSMSASFSAINISSLFVQSQDEGELTVLSPKKGEESSRKSVRDISCSQDGSNLEFSIGIDNSSTVKDVAESCNLSDLKLQHPASWEDLTNSGENKELACEKAAIDTYANEGENKIRLVDQVCKARTCSMEKSDAVEIDVISKEETTMGGASLDNGRPENKQSELEEKYNAARDSISTEKEGRYEGPTQCSISSSQHLYEMYETTKSEHYKELNASAKNSCENAESKAGNAASNDDEDLRPSLWQSNNDDKGKCSVKANDVFESPMKFHVAADNNVQQDILSTTPTTSTCKFEGMPFGSKAAESLIGASATVCSSIVKSTASESRKVVYGDSELSISSVGGLGSEMRGILKFKSDEGAKPCYQNKNEGSIVSPFVNQGPKNAGEIKTLEIAGTFDKLNDQLIGENEASGTKGARESGFIETESMAPEISDAQGLSRLTSAGKILVACEASIECNFQPPVIVDGLIPSSAPSTATLLKSRAVITPFRHQELESSTSKNTSAAEEKRLNFVNEQVLKEAEAAESRERCDSGLRETESMAPEVSDDQGLNQFIPPEDGVQTPVEGLNPSEVSIATVCKARAEDKDANLFTPLQNREVESSMGNAQDSSESMSESFSAINISSLFAQSHDEGELTVLSLKKEDKSIRCSEDGSNLDYSIGNDKRLTVKDVEETHDLPDLELQHLAFEDDLSISSEKKEHTCEKAGDIEELQSSESVPLYDDGDYKEKADASPIKSSIPHETKPEALISTRETGSQGLRSSPFSVTNWETDYKGVEDADQAEGNDIVGPVVNEPQPSSGNKKAADEIQVALQDSVKMAEDHYAQEVEQQLSSGHEKAADEIQVALYDSVKMTERLEAQEGSVHGEANNSKDGVMTNLSEALEISNTGDGKSSNSDVMAEFNAEQGYSIKEQNLNEEQVDGCAVPEDVCMTENGHLASEKPEDLQSMPSGVVENGSRSMHFENGEIGALNDDDNTEKLDSCEEMLVSGDEDEKGHDVTTVEKNADILPTSPITDAIKIDFGTDTCDHTGTTSEGKLVNVSGSKAMAHIDVKRFSQANKVTEGCEGNSEAKKDSASLLLYDFPFFNLSDKELSVAASLDRCWDSISEGTINSAVAFKDGECAEAVVSEGTDSSWPSAFEDFSHDTTEGKDRQYDAQSCMFSSWEIDNIWGQMAKYEFADVPEQSVDIQQQQGQQAGQQVTEHKDPANSSTKEPGFRSVAGNHIADDKVLRSSSVINTTNSRSILIHGTPKKPALFAHDMKENTPALKMAANVTAVRPKRKALEDLKQ